MLDDIKVSIIMAVYNESQLMIEESINSIISQSHSNFEFIIVIDNPSNIELKKFILSYAKKDSRIVIIENYKNMGLAKSLNIALERSNCEIIARMDADDIAYPDRIELQLNYLRNNPEIDLIGNKVEYINEENQVIGVQHDLVVSEKLIDKLLPFGNVLNHPTWMFKKSILENLKGYREFPSSQDYDFLLRALYYGYRINNLNTVVLKYRIRSNSISMSKKTMQLKTVLYIQKLYSQRTKKGFDYFDLNIALEINRNEDKRFKRAHDKYELAKQSFKKNMYIKAFYNLLFSLVISKDEILIFKNDINIKLINRSISSKL